MKMRVRLLTADDTIELGDYIQSENWRGKKTHRIHRVTPKYAFVRWNDAAEGSFNRTDIGTGGSVRLRGSGDWNTVTYKVCRKVEEA
jgi:hypothetical protein